MIAIWGATWQLGIGVLLIAMGLGVLVTAFRRSLAVPLAKDAAEMEPIEYLDAQILHR